MSDTETGSGIDIQKRSILKSIDTHIDTSGETRKYPRYSITLPRKFVEDNNILETGLFVISDRVWIGVPEEKNLMRLIVLLPDIRKLVTNSKLSEVDIKKILELNPEILEFIKNSEVSV